MREGFCKAACAQTGGALMYTSAPISGLPDIGSMSVQVG